MNEQAIERYEELSTIEPTLFKKKLKMLLKNVDNSAL